MPHLQVMGRTSKILLPVILLFGVFFSGSAYAGGEEQPTGARRIGLGGAFTAVGGDFWGIFANPAGISGMQSMAAGVHIEQRYLLSGLNYGAIGFATPFKEKHYAGLDVSGFGFNKYRESRVGLTYATTIFERLSLGAKFNYSITSIENYGNAGSFFVDAGLIGKVSDELSIGFKVFNANQAAIHKETNERIPTILSFGAAYQPSDKVLVVADLEKHVNYPLSFRGGFEYAFVEKFRARVGVSTAPVSFNAGLGFNSDKIDIDFAMSWHEQLGFTPFLSLGYKFNNTSSSAE